MSEVIVEDPPLETPPTDPVPTDSPPVESTPTDTDPSPDPVEGGPDQSENPLVLPTEVALFLATLMQEQTITQERLDESAKKLNYMKVHCSNTVRLSRAIRDLIKVYEDRIALEANTDSLTV